MISSALCQSLAFPEMTAAVNDLIGNRPGSPSIQIHPISRYGIPSGHRVEGSDGSSSYSLAFGALRSLVSLVTNYEELLLGVLTGPEGDSMLLAPLASHVLHFGPNGRLIIATRKRH